MNGRRREGGVFLSIIVQEYVWGYASQGWRPPAMLTLLAIADYCHPDGTGAYPSIATLAQKTGLTERSVQRIVHHLRDAGVITIKPGHGRGRANVYSIPMAVKGDIEDVKGDIGEIKGDIGDIGEPERVTFTTPKGDIGAAKGDFGATSNQEPLIEPSVYIASGRPLVDVVWPDWYADLSEIPGFNRTLELCQKWLTKKSISESQADAAAAALRGQWPGSRRQYKDAWATFRNWVQRPALQSHSPPRATRKTRLSSTEDLKKGWGGNNHGEYVHNLTTHSSKPSGGSTSR